MIGGGLGSMIGNVHRYALNMDQCYDLVAGAFSTQLNKSQQLAKQLGMDLDHIYPNYQAMFEKELLLSDDERIQAVSIVTPNDTHFEIAQQAFKAGFHIIIDKPLTLTYQQAQALQTIQKNSKKLCCVTYTYSGYPMIKEARSLLQNHCLGAIKKIIVNFPQGWLSNQENDDNKQAKWRLDPNRAIAGTLTDIGTHAFHLAEYVSGLKVTDVCAQLNTFIKHRVLDDDVSILMNFNNDARGVITVSQIAAGHEANISITVYAEEGSLFWQQNDANTLIIQWLHRPTEIRRSGTDHHYLSDIARYNCRTPAGHPEGFIEAFANHYRNFAQAILRDAYANDVNLHETQRLWDDYPKIEEGVRGLAFIESVLASAQSERKWVALRI